MKVMVTVTDIDDDWKSSTYTVEHEDPQYVADELVDFVRRKVAGASVLPPADLGLMGTEYGPHKP